MIDTDASGLLSVQDAPDLAPLRASHEANQLEAELKALFTQMFDAYIRPGLSAVGTVGAPHLGNLDQLERAVKVDGIALQRSVDEGAMRYLHKAYRARNPKRGLHMLKAYLQLLLRDNWSVHQLWQDPTKMYGEDLSEVSEAGYFLTSRVLAKVRSTGSATRPELLAQALRSVLPARIVLDVLQSATPFVSDLRIAVAVSGLQAFGDFTGDILPAPKKAAGAVGIRVAIASIGAAEIADYTGDMA